MTVLITYLANVHRNLCFINLLLKEIVYFMFFYIFNPKLDYNMSNKCSVLGCKSGYKDGPDYPRFKFPRDQEPTAKWLLFLTRPADYEVTDSSFICSRDFQPTYLKVTANNLTRLNYHLDPIPTIHPESIPKSQASVPTKSSPPPKERICQQDEISIFEEKFRIRQFLDVVEFLRQAPEYVDFKLLIEEEFVTAYHLVICSGVASVKECITIYTDFHLKLSYDGSPIPLPNYIQETTGHELTHLDVLENLPNYCQNFTQTLMLMLLKNYNFVTIALAVDRSTHPKFCGFL